MQAKQKFHPSAGSGQVLSSERFIIVTYGCQMNEAESRRIAEILITNYECTITNLEKADLIIINSCSVRQGSEDKVYGLGQKIIPLKKGGGGPKVILTGCMVGSAKGERTRYNLAKLRRKMPWVDEFLSFEELVACFAMKGFSFPHSTRRVESPYLIPISQGCNNFCSYCVVPYSRGEEVSRPEEEILCEIERAVKAGHRHIMLLGQNVNSWGSDLPVGAERALPAGAARCAPTPTQLPFSRLLKKVHSTKGVTKISFLTLNPYDINNELIETLALPKFDRYIHLPAQSGDNGILRRMNRRYTVEEYLRFVKRMRAKIPGVKIGTDIIVGFCGETKEQFANTLKLVKEVGFKQIFVGIYSEREGTAAAKFKDTVPLEEKKRRHKEMMRVWTNSKL